MNASELRTIASKYVDHENARTIVDDIQTRLPELSRGLDPRTKLDVWLRSYTVKRAMEAARPPKPAPQTEPETEQEILAVQKEGIAAALHLLTQVDREACEAVLQRGMTRAEAAESLGVPRYLFEARYLRALRILKKSLAA